MYEGRQKERKEGRKKERKEEGKEGKKEETVAQHTQLLNDCHIGLGCVPASPDRKSGSYGQDD
jgi:hypothetical protein